MKRPVRISRVGSAQNVLYLFPVTATALRMATEQEELAMSDEHAAEAETQQVAVSDSPSSENSTPSDSESWASRIPKWIPLALAGVLIAGVSFALGRGSDARQERRSERQGVVADSGNNDLKRKHDRWHTEDGAGNGPGSFGNLEGPGSITPGGPGDGGQFQGPGTITPGGPGMTVPGGPGGELRIPSGGQFETGSETPRAQLGVGLDQAAESDGATIESVLDGSPAANAKLEVGDIIVSVDGNTVKNARDLAEIIGSHEPGDTVKIEYRRGDTSATVEVALAESEAAVNIVPMPESSAPAAQSRASNSVA